MKSSGSKLLNIPEAAEFLNMPESSLRYLVQQRSVPSYKPARRVLFDEDELIAWVKRSRRETIDESVGRFLDKKN